MPSTSVIIARNTTYLTVALVIQKIISFAFFLIIARMLGKDGTGEYVAAFSITSIFAVLVDMGLGPVLIRELARERTKSQEYLGNVATVKLLLAMMVAGLLFAVIYFLDWLGKSHPPMGLMTIAAGVMILDSFVLTGTSIFRGWQNLWYESAVIILNKFVILGLGFVVIYLWPSSTNVAIVILIGSFISILLVTFFLKRKLQLVWNFRWNAQIQRELWKLAAPFALANIFSASYAYSDTVILSILKGNSAVGLYSVAAKTMNAFQFIPSAFMAAVFPAMSNYYQHSKEQLKVLFEQSFRYLLIISAPLAVGLYVLADEFVTKVGADYKPAALAVRILMPSLVFVFLSFPLGSLLNATNKQHWQTMLIGFSMALNIGLNLWLIPQYSYIGASWSWFITNFTAFAAGLWVASWIIKYHYSVIALSVLKVSAASLLMGWFVNYTYASEFLPILFIVPSGAAVYAGMLFLLRELQYDDVKNFIRLFQKSQ